MGRGPHTLLVRALLRHAGVGSPCGRDPRGSRSSRIPPPPPASRSLLGGGGRPLGSGGAEGRSCGSQAGGGCGGGGWGGRSPVPLPRRAAACLPLSPACPPGVYSRRGGCWAAAGVRRGPAGRRRVSAAGGGGGGGAGNPPALVRAPVFPGPASDEAAPFVPSCAPAPWVQRPLQGGCGAAVSSVCLRPLLGLSGRGGVGGGPLVPWGRLLTARGGQAWRSRPRGPAIGWGVAPFPSPPLPRAGPSCRPSLGPLNPPAVVAWRWPAGGGCEG